MTKKELVVGFQHFIAMFGATILVPLLTGFPVSIALFTSGVGTLIFHYVTDKKVPAYLGSSFAFIAPLSLVIADYGGVSSALGGIIFAGLIYVITGWLLGRADKSIIRKIFPPVVTGPIIMIIGLSLAPIAIGNIEGTGIIGIFIAILTLITAMITVLKGKGLLKVLPIITGVFVGYVASMIIGVGEAPQIAEAAIIGLPSFQLPTFNLTAITIIAPVAIVTMIEHIGDILAISETIGKDRKLITNPGINKTLYGDGLATLFAGLVGGLPNTTYGENTGVLALTNVYKSSVIRVGAVIAIITSFVPKFEALIMGIPEPVIGGISILLFGMITAVGIRTLIKDNTDLQNSRNLIIISTILVLGLGGAVIEIGAVEISSMSLAAITGIILNLLLPEER